jgi:hypothetical protein
LYLAETINDASIALCAYSRASAYSSSSAYLDMALRQATFQAPIPLPRMDNWHDGPRSIDGSINWLRRPSKALVSGWAARYAHA